MPIISWVHYLKKLSNVYFSRWLKLFLMKNNTVHKLTKTFLRSDRVPPSIHCRFYFKKIRSRGGGESMNFPFWFISVFFKSNLPLCLWFSVLPFLLNSLRIKFFTFCLVLNLYPNSAGIQFISPHIIFSKYFTTRCSLKYSKALDIHFK